LKPKIRFKVLSEFVEAVSLTISTFSSPLEENAIYQHSKPEDPSTESNPHRFGPPTDNPHRHGRKEEAVPHLYTRDNKIKA
jgi:hypothetical protein